MPLNDWNRESEQKSNAEESVKTATLLQKEKRLARISFRALLLWASRFVRRKLLPLSCLLLCAVILFAGSAWVFSTAIQTKTKDRITIPEELIANSKTFDCILILGCGVYRDGSLTPMLSDRVETGVELFSMGLAETILMSGDHETEDYNEVDPMRRAAIRLGVDAESIETDPYGLSTYESVVRVKEVYGKSRVLIVTQSYHLPRALYIAEKLGIDAYGVSADRRPYRDQAKYDLRELLARCKDMVLTQIRPKLKYPA